jgi:hypothetical protein
VDGAVVTLNDQSCVCVGVCGGLYGIGGSWVSGYRFIHGLNHRFYRFYRFYAYRLMVYRFTHRFYHLAGLCGGSTYIYTYIHIHIYTYTHIHTYIHIPGRALWGEWSLASPSVSICCSFHTRTVWVYRCIGL